MNHPRPPSFILPSSRYAGHFRVSGTNLVISDIVDTQKFTNVASGEWLVFFERVVVQQVEYVASVVVLHEQTLQPDTHAQWEDAHFTIGVDIGSIAIFDEPKFVGATAPEEDHEAFRDLWNASVTTSIERGINVVERGCFVEAGNGNGNYKCEKIEVDGLVRGVRVDFARDVFGAGDDRRREFADIVFRQRLADVGWSAGETIVLTAEGMERVAEMIDAAPRPCEQLRAAARRQRDARLLSMTTNQTSLRRGQRVRIIPDSHHAQTHLASNCKSCGIRGTTMRHGRGTIAMTHETNPDICDEGWYQIAHDCGDLLGAERSDIVMEEHAPTLLFQNVTCVGGFSATSTKMLVSDTLSDQHFDNVALGRWHVFLERDHLSTWGERNASMTIVHESLLDAATVPPWEDTTKIIAVETGVVTAFDGARFCESFRANWVYFSSLVEKNGCHVLSSGAIAQSPWTQGRYRIEKITSANGDVVAVRIDLASDTSDDTVVRFGKDVNERRSLQTTTEPAARTNHPLPTHTIGAIGQFRVTSDKLALSDIVDDEYITRVVPGNWHVFVEHACTTEGERIASISVIHELHIASMQESSWIDSGICKTVDTSQASIFCADQFVSSDEDDETKLGVFRVWWFGTGKYDPCRADVVEGGVVATSGIGDGHYRVEVMRDPDEATVVGVRLDFASDVDDSFGARFAEEVAMLRAKRSAPTKKRRSVGGTRDLLGRLLDRIDQPMRDKLIARGLATWLSNPRLAKLASGRSKEDDNNVRVRIAEFDVLRALNDVEWLAAAIITESRSRGADTGDQYDDRAAINIWSEYTLSPTNVAIDQIVLWWSGESSPTIITQPQARQLLSRLLALPAHAPLETASAFLVVRASGLGEVDRDHNAPD